MKKIRIMKEKNIIKKDINKSTQKKIENFAFEKGQSKLNTAEGYKFEKISFYDDGTASV